jgi:hypothetical protein
MSVKILTSLASVPSNSVATTSAKAERPPRASTADTRPKRNLHEAMWMPQPPAISRIEVSAKKTSDELRAVDTDDIFSKYVLPMAEGSYFSTKDWTNTEADSQARTDAAMSLLHLVFSYALSSEYSFREPGIKALENLIQNLDGKSLLKTPKAGLFNGEGFIDLPHHNFPLALVFMSLGRELAHWTTYQMLNSSPAKLSAEILEAKINRISHFDSKALFGLKEYLHEVLDSVTKKTEAGKVAEAA